MMNERKTVKIALLALILLCTALLLSGCIFTPEEINTQDPGVGNAPIPTIAVVTASPTPENVGQPIVLLTNPPTDVVIHLITPTPNAGATVPMGAEASPVPTFSTITSTPAPTSSTLKKGSTGEAVKHVQTMLRALGFYTGSLDGDYGDGTEKAVKDFQKQYKLTEDGKVGPKTLTALEKAKATKRPTASPTPKATPKKTATPKPTQRSTATPRASSYSKLYLRLGSKGSDVKKMQERLISLGYLSGNATGSFDGTTEKAIIAFQKRNCSYSDGVAGPDTLTALYSADAKRTSSSAGTIGISYRYGDSGDKVKAIQQKLKDLEYFTGSCTGTFGPATEEAVKAFQRKNGLSADGVVGDGTMSKLFSSKAVSNKKTPTPKPTKKVTATPRRTATPNPNPYVRVTKSPNDKYVTLCEGNWGQPVSELQVKLKAAGYFSGEVDGIFGEQTAEAVKKFQRAKGLTVDGIAGYATQQVLFEGDYPEGS